MSRLSTTAGALRSDVNSIVGLLLLSLVACGQRDSSKPDSVTADATTGGAPVVASTAAGSTSARPEGSTETLEFAVDKACDTSQALKCPLKIVKVRITPKVTIVMLRYQAVEPNKKVRVWPPLHKSAFYLVTTTEATKYRLLNVDGIAIGPEMTNAPLGIPIDFTLTFERLPSDTKSFHLIEGDETMTGQPRQRFFRFMNVELGAPTMRPN